VSGVVKWRIYSAEYTANFVRIGQVLQKKKMLWLTLYWDVVLEFSTNRDFRVRR